MVCIEPQSFAGTKVRFKSVPWESVVAFGVESAGASIDTVSKMMIWTDIWYDKAEGEMGQPTPGMSYIEEELEKDRVDVPAIGRYLAAKCAKLAKENSESPSEEKFWVDETAAK